MNHRLSRRSFLGASGMSLAGATPTARAAPTGAGGATPVAAADDLVSTPRAPRAFAHAYRARNPGGPLEGGACVLDGTGGAAGVVYDFGEEIVGDVSVEVRARGDAELRLFYGEDLVEALVTEDHFPAPNWYRLPQDRARLRAGAEERMRNAGRRAFRFLHVRLASGRGPVTIQGVSATLVHRRVRTDTHIAVSDPLLQEAVAISARTVRLCMQRFYEDGVKRDGILWIGDYRVEYLCNALLYGDHALAKRCLEMFFAGSNPDGSVTAAAIRGGGHQHPSRIDYMPGMGDRGGFLDRWVLDNYCTDLVSSLREYHDLSGDLSTVRALWPATLKLLGYLRAVDVEKAVMGKTFITDITHGVSSWWGARGALAMHLVWAQRDGALLAARLGDGAARAACERGMAAAIVRANGYRNSDGRFREESAPDAPTGWQVNALAVLAGLVDPRAGARLLGRCAEDRTTRRPMAGFMEHWLLEALFLSGRAKEALDEMRTYWGHMLASGATTTWDVVDVTKPGIARPSTHAMSHCHAWSASPAWVVPARVLGVRPASPGFAAVEIAPQLGDLGWAEALVPTAAGDLFVRFEAKDGRVAGEVDLPAGMRGHALVDGRRVRLQPGRNVIDRRA